jgi:hypothetical protein
MTIYIFLNVLTNCVPAVAAIRKRLVLFILNRFKGYPSSKISLKKRTIFLEFNIRRSYQWRRDHTLSYLKGLVKAKATSYVKTDAEGRRHRELAGLGTPVVFADNDECHRLDFYLVYK